jgi:hypothetical protein
MSGRSRPGATEELSMIDIEVFYQGHDGIGEGPLWSGAEKVL